MFFVWTGDIMLIAMTTPINKGFVLISLIITIAIIAILTALYYSRTEEGKPSPRETGQKAIEEAKINNALELQHQIEIQNELNSINR